MRKAKKLLGFAGLAAVGLMTAIAYCLPAPEAVAAESTDININVTVRESHASVYLRAPKDGEIAYEKDLEVVTDYTETIKIDYVLKYTDTDGNEQTFNLPAYTPSAQDGTHKFQLNLDDYGFGSYELTAIITGVGGTTFEDSVKFNYNAIRVETIGADADGNPIVKIYANPAVGELDIQAYDKTGDPVFTDGADQDRPLHIASDQFDNDHTVTLTLPMGDYGADAGDYIGIVIPYDASGDLIDAYPFDFEYVPVINVPNTGLSMTQLNISKADYLITGLVMFGSVAGFAIFLVTRKNRR